MTAPSFPNRPRDMAALLDWIKANPGRFTYPAPPDFTGSAFVRHVFIHAAGGPETLIGPFDQATFDEVAAKTWAILNEIEPFLWREGQTYPTTVTQLNELFANGEVAFTFNYDPAQFGLAVDAGTYPETTRSFGLTDGTIGNTNYTLIPFNRLEQGGSDGGAEPASVGRGAAGEGQDRGLGRLSRNRDLPHLAGGAGGLCRDQGTSFGRPGRRACQGRPARVAGRLADRNRGGLEGERRELSWTGRPDAPCAQARRPGTLHALANDGGLDLTQRTRIFLLLAPAVLLLGGLFLAGLGLGLVRSLRYMPVIGLTEPDLQAYAAVLSAPGFLASLGLSLWIAGASTLISAAIAACGGAAFARGFSGPRDWSASFSS